MAKAKEIILTKDIVEKFNNVENKESISEILNSEYGIGEVRGTTLDAFDRFLHENEIYTQSIPELGIEASRVSKLIATDGNRILFPEYVARTLRMSIQEESILGRIIATTTQITGDSMRTPTFDDSKKTKDGKKNRAAMENVRVAEGADIPIDNIKLKDVATVLHKYGRGTGITNEVANRMTFDLLKLYIQRRGSIIADAQVGDIIDMLQGGNENYNTGTGSTLYKNSELAGAGAVSGKIDPKAFLKWIMRMQPFGIDTAVVNEELYIDLALMWNETQVINSITPGVSFTMPQNILKDFNVLYSDKVKKKNNHETVVGLNAKTSILKIEERGIGRQERDYNPENQTSRVFMTETAGFDVMFDDSVSQLEID